MEIKASIIKKKNRPYWHIKCTIFNNQTQKRSEISTKVDIHEKPLKWMKEHYLPAWIQKQKKELGLPEGQKPLTQRDRSFKAYAVMFLEQYESNYDYQNVNYRTKRIITSFGSRNIDEITKLEIKQWLNSLVHAKNESKTASHNTKMKYLRIFRGIFELAVDGEVIEKNFCYDIRIPKKREEKTGNEIKPFNSKEVALLLQASKNPEYGEYMHLYLGVAFNQGMSPAEILGLQVADIDFKQKTVSITRNITKGKDPKETKTECRKRTIPMFRSAEPYFRELLNRAIDKKSLWLLSKESGTHLEDIKDIRGNREIIKHNKKIKSISKWYKLLEDLSIEYRDLKNCRHTFAVQAVKSKAFTLQEIANILGHGSLQMLFKHYAKYIDKNEALNVDRNIQMFGDTFGDTLQFEKEEKT